MKNMTWPTKFIWVSYFGFEVGMLDISKGSVGTTGGSVCRVGAPGSALYGGLVIVQCVK